MKLEVSEEAAKWYRSEMNVKPGDYVRFIVKLYGGIPTVHPNYYLGLSVGKEGEAAVQDVVGGITFYFSDQDAWLLEDYDLQIVKKNEEVEYIFHHPDQ